MPSSQWVKPALDWSTSFNDFRQDEFEKPRLLKFSDDNFLPDFLKAMSGSEPGLTPTGYLRNPDHFFNAPEDFVNDVHEVPVSPRTIKLYQPMHQRYYMVTASLICRQLGLPDHTIARQNQEKTGFLIRKLVAVTGGMQEQAWVKDANSTDYNWQPVIGDARQLVAGEETLPMHPVKVCTCPNSGSNLDLLGMNAARERTLFYGYIPTGKREKYIKPLANPLNALNNYQYAPSSKHEDDYRLGEIEARVLKVWRGLYRDFADNSKPPPASISNIQDDQLNKVSLYLILDLGEFLQRVLPNVFKAIQDSNANELTAGSKARTLYDEIDKIKLQRNPADSKPEQLITLATALRELVNFLPLVQGIGTEPTDKTYDMLDSYKPDGSKIKDNVDYLKAAISGNTLYQRISDALIEGGSSLPSAQVPSEVADMIKVEPEGGDIYYIRVVYQHEPCDAVVSKPTDQFTFAKFYDPDAPARHIRIELPDIKNLRKFKRGIGMQTSPELRSLMDRVNAAMLTGGGLSSEVSAWELGLICSFSIQIITLVAFIVMFIFLISFNFIFWWMAFLKICFPIPIPKKGP